MQRNNRCLQFFLDQDAQTSNRKKDMPIRKERIHFSTISCVKNAGQCPCRNLKLDKANYLMYNEEKFIGEVS